MPFGIQPVHLIVIALVALLVFGPSKLPDIGRGVGKAMVEFKRGMRDMSEGFQEEVAQPVAPSMPVTSPVVYQSAVPAQSASAAVPVQAVPRPGVVYCTVCGSANPGGARFCNTCGSAMPLVSPETKDSTVESQTVPQAVVEIQLVQLHQIESVDSTASNQ